MGVHESKQDLAALEALLERSYATAGAHLLRIHTPERRLTAEQVAARLSGMCLLALATTTADCRPILGPVDGVTAESFGEPGRRTFRLFAQTGPGRVSLWLEKEQVVMLGSALGWGAQKHSCGRS